VAAYAFTGSLGILSVLAWVVVAGANMPIAGTLDIVPLVLFTLIWGVGMVAMMFPSLVPMIYSVAVSARKSLEDSTMSSRSVRLLVSLRSGLFVMGYVAIWTFVGLAFYVTIGGLALVGIDAGLGTFGFWAGIVLIVVGLYQFTRFKQRALMKCRSPMSFVMSRWRSGNSGACLMGADYGMFCTKCCWVLMAGLLVVGAMSLPLMGVFTIIILAEKIAPFGGIISRVIGGGFIATGLVLLIQ
jgi:predicted metal-binding membrane protein